MESASHYLFNFDHHMAPMPIEVMNVSEGNNSTFSEVRGLTFKEKTYVAATLGKCCGVAQELCV